MDSIAGRVQVIKRANARDVQGMKKPPGAKCAPATFKKASEAVLSVMNSPVLKIVQNLIILYLKLLALFLTLTGVKELILLKQKVGRLLQLK